MARLFLVVESASPLADFVCRVKGLGGHRHILLMPGIASEPGEVFRLSDGLVLKRPDGSTLGSATSSKSVTAVPGTAAG